LAAEGPSTRSIAKAVGVQPRIVSLWRHRYAEQGLEGLEDKPRPGKKPIYTKATDRRILALLDKPPPKGFGRWSGPLLAAALGDVDVQSLTGQSHDYKRRPDPGRQHRPDEGGRQVRIPPRLQVRDLRHLADTGSAAHWPTSPTPSASPCT
jgi:hypothetical protein